MALVLVTAFSIIFAVYLKPVWNAESLPLSDAPERLREILTIDNEKLIDLRQFEAGAKLQDGGFVWRVRWSQEFEDLHKKKFWLDPVDSETENKTLLMNHIPSDWPEIRPDEADWFASKMNWYQDGNLGHWYTMAICRDQKMIYFLYSHWDYTP